MSFLDRVEGKSGASISTSLDLFRELAGGWRNNTGQTVSWKTALQVSTVLACARIRAQGLAQVPLKLMRTAGREILPATDHPLYDVLALKPNEFQTSFEYRETLGLHLALAGPHYSFINRMPGSGRVAGLYPFEPQHVTVNRVPGSWKLTYTVQRDGLTPVEFGQEQIWHVKGPSWSGHLALEIVKLARESIGLAMATEEQHAKMHKNGARVGGLVSVEGTLTDEKYKQMRAWLEKYFEGTSNENAGRTMILDRAAKFTQASQTGVDSQHLETRRFQIEEVCRFMGVLPIMVGYSDKATTYASAEQMFISHLVNTLAPDYERLEQSISVNILSEKDRREGIKPKFIEEGLLRASSKDTKDVILGYVNGGVMTPNEGRAKLDLNPDADPKSDELRIPANIAGAQPVEPPQDPKAKSEADLREAMIARLAEPLPAPVVHNHVDARTTIEEGAVHVSAPVDARSTTTIAEGAVKLSAPVSISEGDVVLPSESDSVTEHDRDPITKEIIRSRKKVVNG